MFQSNVNLFGNSSSFFSIHQLKKILRIPQDQLSQLNNIPGWSSCEKTISETSTASSHSECKNSTEKDNFEKKNYLSKSDYTSSNSTESVRIVNQQSSKNNFISEQEFLFFNSEKPSLLKSKSLNFLNLKSSVVSKKLKRSFSFPDMEKSLSLESELNFPFLRKKNEETGIMRNIFIEKSEFMDSAVQCKMSQSSQPILEMPLSKRIEILAANKEKVFSELSENQQETKSASKCEEIQIPDLPVTSVFQTASESKTEFNNKENNSIQGKKESSIETFNKNVTSEESFVSQALPCAQPCSADITKNDVVVTYDQKLASSISNFNDPSAVPPNKSTEMKKLTTKRKRYNKSEKDSKKMKSLDNIDIVYSSEQIKNMIEMMKTVLK